MNVPSSCAPPQARRSPDAMAQVLGAKVPPEEADPAAAAAGPRRIRLGCVLRQAPPAADRVRPGASRRAGPGRVRDQRAAGAAADAAPGRRPGSLAGKVRGDGVALLVPGLRHVRALQRSSAGLSKAPGRCGPGRRAGVRRAVVRECGDRSAEAVLPAAYGKFWRRRLCRVEGTDVARRASGHLSPVSTGTASRPPPSRLSTATSRSASRPPARRRTRGRPMSIYHHARRARRGCSARRLRGRAPRDGVRHRETRRTTGRESPAVRRTVTRAVAYRHPRVFWWSCAPGPHR